MTRLSHTLTDEHHEHTLYQVTTAQHWIWIKPGHRSTQFRFSSFPFSAESAHELDAFELASSRIRSLEA